MAFLQELLKHSAHNRLDVNILGRLTMHFHYLFLCIFVCRFESTGQFQWKAEPKGLFYTKHIQLLGEDEQNGKYCSWKQSVEYHSTAKMLLLKTD